MRRVYLDHTATTPLDPQVFEAMKPYFTDEFGNASSIHRFGQEARAALDRSRDTIARAIGARSGEIFFVSGGTEADNFAIKGAASVSRRKSGKRHIVTSRIEHHAVLETCRFLSSHEYEISYVEPDEFGIIHPATVEAAITPATSLVSIMHVNNEIGTINPVKDIGRVVRDHGIAFHVDAVQAFGKLELNVDDLSADLLSISGHKIYGPKGIGALFIRKGVDIESFVHGGGQERGRRAGTENVPLAVGFAEAATRVLEERTAEWSRLAGLKSQLRQSLEESFPFVVWNGRPAESIPHILNVSFDSRKIDIDGESLLFNLDLHGIAATSGSACTSGSIEPSHVLLAIGRDPKTAKATIRCSMGKSTTGEDIEYVVAALRNIVSAIGTRTS